MWSSFLIFKGVFWGSKTGESKLKYHIIKLARIYEGRPYCGPTSGFVPAEYDSLPDAKFAADDFLTRNAVGWQVFDSETGEMLYDTGIGKPQNMGDV